MNSFTYLFILTAFL